MKRDYVIYWVCPQCAGIEETSMYVRGITHWHGASLFVLRSSKSLTAAKLTNRKILKQKGDQNEIQSVGGG